MARIHVSEDGKPRPCNAQTAESCTAKGPDGSGSPHGEFANVAEANRFAESVMERAMENQGVDSLGSTSKQPKSAEAPPIDSPRAQSLIRAIEQEKSELRGASMDEQMESMDRIGRLTDELEKERATKAAPAAARKEAEQPKPVQRPTPSPEARIARTRNAIAGLKAESHPGDTMAEQMESNERLSDLNRSLERAERAHKLIDRGSRPEYVGSIDKKHFGAGNGAGSRFTDGRARNVDELISLADKQRGNLDGDDREALIRDGANPKDFAPAESGIRYLRVEIQGDQMLKSTAKMKDSNVLEVRAKGGNDGRPASLSFAAPGGAQPVGFGTVVVGPKIGEDRKPIAGTETVYTAHPGVPTRGIRSDAVREAGLDGGSTITVGEFRKKFGRDIEVNSY